MRVVVAAGARGVGRRARLVPPALGGDEGSGGTTSTTHSVIFGKKQHPSCAQSVVEPSIAQSVIFAYFVAVQCSVAPGAAALRSLWDCATTSAGHVPSMASATARCCLARARRLPRRSGFRMASREPVRSLPLRAPDGGCERIQFVFPFPLKIFLRLQLLTARRLFRHFKGLCISRKILWCSLILLINSFLEIHGFP